jgi:hypothetical protein
MWKKRPPVPKKDRLGRSRATNFRRLYQAKNRE